MLIEAKSNTIQPRTSFYAAGDAPVANEPCLATVPVKPTLEMLTAGARAGNVTVETVWRIFQAMIKQN
ncbi:MAG: hypothetical protein P4M00_10180 [Azospirillaceae bacterium]|nr:hypothetical protein [Azospirillaceae bacterium]